MTGAAPRTTVLILAAGRGERLGGRPKAFLELNGETLLERVVRLGRRIGDEVVAAVPASDLARAERIVRGEARVIEGGPTRADTFHALLAAAEGSAMTVYLDVAHPLTSVDLCRRVIAAAGLERAAVAAQRLHDLAAGDDGAALTGRGRLHLLQKPIVAPYEPTLHGADEARRRGLPVSTDDAPGVLELLRLAGVPLELVESEPWNVKLTTRDDWRMIETLAANFG